VVLEVVWEGMDWIDLAQNTDRWQLPVDAVMNLPVPTAVQPPTSCLTLLPEDVSNVITWRYAVKLSVVVTQLTVSVLSLPLWWDSQSCRSENKADCSPYCGFMCASPFVIMFHYIHDDCNS
jgi:hypothetical protein